MPRSRIPAIAALTAAVALSASGCRKPEPIRLGYVGGLTGRHYDLGVSGRNGAQLAVAELNAAGGIRGRPVELLVRDDGQDAAQARRAVQELVDAGVVAIIGHMTSSMVQAGLPIAEGAGILMVSPTASAASFRGKEDGFVTLFPSNAEMARALAVHVVRHTPIRRVTILVDQSNLAFSATWGEAFAAELVRRGGAVIATEPFTSGTGVSLGALADRVLAARPDAVLVVANALDSASLSQQLRKRAPGLRLLGTDWGFTQDVMTHGASAVEGALFTQAIDVDDRSPRFTAFRDAYQGRFARPVDFAAAVAYEAVQVVAEGLRRTTEPAGLGRAIVSVGSFHGVQGDVLIDRYGDAQRGVRIMTIRGDRMVAAE